MYRSRHLKSFILALCLFSCAHSLFAQQKAQWLPGQMGLNSGILPSPGITYANIALNYNSGRFNGPTGASIPDGLVTGKYNVWADENIFYYVPKIKVAGGNLGFMLILTPVSGFLTADLLPNLTTVTVSGGGGGLTNLWIQPFTLGWHKPRVDFLVADGLMLNTGRYSPGATNNVGLGYFGNHLQTGTTYYITKNKGTSANLFTDWEAHGSRTGTNGTSKTPGQAFTMEWGIGQVLPIKKNMSQLLQIGMVGYDQFEVTSDSGTIPIPGTSLTTNANVLPGYSNHAVGFQANYILPAKSFVGFFKYYDEYRALSHFQGRTIVFGLNYTFLIPKPPPPAAHP